VSGKELLASLKKVQKRSIFEAQVHHFYSEARNNSQDLKKEKKLQY
jgi:hypothetical protein